MRIALFGCTDLTKKVLDTLIKYDKKPSIVVTAPKEFEISYRKEFKNKRHYDFSDYLQDNDIPLLHFESNAQIFESLKEKDLDLAFVAGWYHMVPKVIRNLFQKGCLGLHASLLPDLRGGAPLNWAILLGRQKTGVTLFQLEEGVDEGNIVDQRAFTVDDQDSIGDLIQKSHEATVFMMRDFCKKGLKIPRNQSGEVTYALQRAPEDSLIQWSTPNQRIVTLVRASSRPYAGAYTFLGEKKVILWKISINQEYSIYGRPGQICRIYERVFVVCGDFSSIEIHDVFVENEDDGFAFLLKQSHKYFELTPCV